MMPYAKGVSAKSYDFDSSGKETKLDYARILKIVTDANTTALSVSSTKAANCASRKAFARPRACSNRFEGACISLGRDRRTSITRASFEPLPDPLAHDGPRCCLDRAGIDLGGAAIDFNQQFGIEWMFARAALRSRKHPSTKSRRSSSGKVSATSSSCWAAGLIATPSLQSDLNSDDNPIVLRAASGVEPRCQSVTPTRSFENSHRFEKRT